MRKKRKGFKGGNGNRGNGGGVVDRKRCACALKGKAWVRGSVFELIGKDGERQMVKIVFGRILLRKESQQRIDNSGFGHLGVHLWRMCEVPQTG